jgi:signal peptidase I
LAITTRRRRFSDYTGVADLLIAQGRCRFRVSSDSMAPTLRPGDLIDLHAVAADEIVPGDLVVIKIGSTLLCHRAVDRYTASDGQQWIVTRGDVGVGHDPPVAADDVIGRVHCVRRPSFLGVLQWQARCRIAQLFQRFTNRSHE